MDTLRRRLHRQAQATGAPEDYARFYAEEAKFNQGFAARLQLAAALGSQAAMMATLLPDDLRTLFFMSDDFGGLRLPPNADLTVFLRAAQHYRTTAGATPWIQQFIATAYYDLNLYGMASLVAATTFREILLLPWEAGFDRKAFENEISFLEGLTDTIENVGTELLFTRTMPTWPEFFRLIDEDVYLAMNEITDADSLIQLLQEMDTAWYWNMEDLRAPGQHDMTFLPSYCRLFALAVSGARLEEPMYDVRPMQRDRDLRAIIWWGSNINQDPAVDGKQYFWDNVMVPITQQLLELRHLEP